MIIAVAIMVIVFTAITPLFRNILNSWDSKAGAAETIQNGRVLIDHLHRNLLAAVKITDVNDSSGTNGYIEFQDNDANTWRYDVNSTSNYVEFGLVGELSDLAGPVSQLQFTCYDGNDFVSSITDGNSIRYVEVSTTLTNSAELGQDRTFTARAYLRTNWDTSSGGSGTDPNLVAWWKLDDGSGITATDSSGNNYHGTLENSPSWVTGGLIDGAMQFNNDGYVDCGTFNPSAATGKLTISLWANWTGTGAANQGLLCKTDYWDAADMMWTCSILTSGSSVGFLREGITIYRPHTLTVGQWEHLAATFDGTTAIFYAAGVEIGQQGFSFGSDTAAEVAFGAGTGGGSNLLSGFLDDIRIYDRALDANEIAELARPTYLDFTEAKATTDVTSLTIDTPGCTSASQDVRVSSNNDDAQEDSGGSVKLNDSKLELGKYDWCGLRFLNVQIEQGATISSAYVEFKADADNSEDTDITIWGQDADTTTTFIDSSYDISGRTPTTASATWDNIESWTYEQLHQTSDIASIIEEIVNRPSWSPGNSIVILFESTNSSGNRLAKTYDVGTPADAPLLHVELAGAGCDNEGDLLIAAVATDGDTSSTLAPPGGENWTPINVGVNGNAVTLGVWWKNAEASESGTHQFTWSGEQEAYGWMMRFIGHDPCNPINDSAGASQNSSTPTSPAVTTTVDNCLILRLGGFDDDDITVDSPGLSGHTAITMDETTASNTSCSGGAGYERATGGSGTSTFSLTATEQSRMVTIAIAPNPDSGSGGGGGVIRP